jgi:hypothetical protein
VATEPMADGLTKNVLKSFGCVEFQNKINMKSKENEFRLDFAFCVSKRWTKSHGKSKFMKGRSFLTIVLIS